MPEEGVVVNEARIPPREYLMRRSYQPLDRLIPGAIVRQTRCENCGTVYTHDMRGRRCYDCEKYTVTVYSVDVPLVKESGERWT